LADVAHGGDRAGQELDGGRAAVSLSPEEQEAVERAMKSQQ
jgi:hypothetical protein